MKTVQEMSLADLRAWRPQRVDFETIREMARRMAERCHPERIVLPATEEMQEAAEIAGQVEAFVLAKFAGAGVDPVRRP